MHEMYLRFPEGRKKAFTLSYDDNTTQDERLIDLMKKYKVKGTFNIMANCFSKEGDIAKDPTYFNVTEKKALEIYDNEFVEVANHGFVHAKMTSLPVVGMMDDIIKCRQKLESMFGRIVTGFAYPYGWYDGKLMQVLADAGISYARTVNSTYNFELPENWLELNPTCHHADEHLDSLVERFLTSEVTERSYMFYVWGHTFEFDRQDNWDLIEDLLKKVSGKEDVWYATNQEIYEYHMAYKSLVFSADSTMVYNPTSIDLWIEIDHNVIFVPAGKTTEVEK